MLPRHVLFGCSKLDKIELGNQLFQKARMGAPVPLHPVQTTYATPKAIGTAFLQAANSSII